MLRVFHNQANESESTAIKPQADLIKSLYTISKLVYLQNSHSLRSCFSLHTRSNRGDIKPLTKRNSAQQINQTTQYVANSWLNIVMAIIGRTYIYHKLLSSCYTPHNRGERGISQARRVFQKQTRRHIYQDKNDQRRY